MIETIATYWEKQIKVYGISNQSDLTLIRITCSGDQLSVWGSHLEQLEADCPRFEMASAQPGSHNTFLLNLVIKDTDVHKLSAKLYKLTANEEQTTFSALSPVALIYFHGPHFQDRFGIAHTLNRALKSLKINVLFCGCSGTSVYVVVPQHEHEKTVSIITDTFLIPGT